MTTDQPGGGEWSSPSPPPVTPSMPPPDPSVGYGYPPPAPPPPGGWATPAPYGWVPPQAPRPGVIPLRPLGVGELLDGAFTTIRKYPSATLGLSAAVMLVVEVVQIISAYYLLRGIASETTTAFGTETNNDYLARLFTVDGIVLVVTLVATGLLTGVLAVIVGQAALGKPMGIGEAWARTRPKLLRLFGTTALVWLSWLLAAIVGALPGVVVVVLGVAAGSDGLAALGIFFMVVGGLCLTVFVYVRLVMATPALMLEDLSIRAALSRSSRLVRSNWWRIFGISALAWLIGTTIGLIVEVPFDLAGGIGSVFSGDTDNQFHFVPLLLSGIGGLISATLVRPFSAGVGALLYIDRRMRSEALDLTLQQAAAAPSP